MAKVAMINHREVEVKDEGKYVKLSVEFRILTDGVYETKPFDLIFEPDEAEVMETAIRVARRRIATRKS